MHGAAIAVEQEARQRRGEYDLVADRDVAVGAADLVFRPGDRHHAGGAGEVRDVEHDLGGAVGIDGDDAGIERERLLRGRAALQLSRRGIAAGLDRAARALHAIDELAIEVAEFGREPALAEIVVVGRRRLVVGQIEDADIDGGDYDARLLAGGKAVDLDRNAHCAVGTQQRRQSEIDRECARLAVDGKPLHADGAAGHALGLRVERTPKRRHHISAAAPVAAGRDADARRAGLYVPRHRGDEPVADHVERHLAGGAGGERDGHGIARRVFRLVERDFEHVGGIGARLRVPAGIEADGGDRAVAVTGGHLQAIAAPLHRNRDARRRVGGDVEGAVGDAAGHLDRLVFERAVAAIPLIFALDLEQLVAHPRARERGALGRGNNNIKSRVLAFAKRAAGERRPDADHGAGGRHGNRELALDRAAAGLGEPHQKLRFERTGGGRLLVEGDGEFRLAVAVGVGKIVERLAHRLDFLIRHAERVARKTGALVGRFDHHLAFELKLGCRRPIEIASVDSDLRQVGLGDALGRGGEVKFEPVRHVVLDHETRLADRGALGVGEGAHAPGAGRRGWHQRDRERMPAHALIGDHRAPVFDAVGTLDHQSERDAQRREPLRVAHQRSDLHGLAGAIDPALGIDEGIEAGRYRAAGNAAVGEIEGRRLEVEEGVVAAGVGGDHHRRRLRAFAAGQRLLELHVAEVVGALGRQNLVAAREQADFDRAARLRGFERMHEGVYAVIAGEGGKPEVGDDEPLGREIVGVVGRHAFGIGHDDVDTGR